MTCPVCNGKGSFRAPYYSDFGPTMRDVPCACIRQRATFAGLWTVLLFLAGMALVAWAAR